LKKSIIFLGNNFVDCFLNFRFGFDLLTICPYLNFETNCYGISR
jgi:hypothetical protein